MIHPKLGIECKHYKTKTRYIKTASLNAPRYITYKLAQYKYKDPKTGKICYWTQEIPDVTGKKKYTNKSIILVTEESLLGKKTLLAASEQAKNKFHFEEHYC